MEIVRLQVMVLPKNNNTITEKPSLVFLQKGRGQFLDTSPCFSENSTAQREKKLKSSKHGNQIVHGSLVRGIDLID